MTPVFRKSALNGFCATCLFVMVLILFPTVIQAANEAEIVAADEADQRGFYAAKLIYVGDGFNVYEPKLPSGIPEFMIIHQVTENEPLFAGIKPPYVYEGSPFAKQLDEIIKHHSSYKPGTFLLGSCFTSHYVRGVHRIGGGKDQNEAPLLQVLFRFDQTTKRLAGGHVENVPRGGMSYISLAQARADGVNLVSSEVVNDLRQQQAAQRQAVIDKENQRIKGEQDKGFLVQGERRWASYSNRVLLENIFRGKFDKIRKSKPSTHAALYYLYQKYVSNFESRCGNYLPPDAVPTQMITVQRMGGVETSREVSGRTMVHPELADAYIYYRNHPAGAGMTAIGDVLRGGAGSALRRQESWDLDMARFFESESCDGKAMGQLRHNMSRLYSDAQSLQAEAGIPN